MDFINIFNDKIRNRDINWEVCGLISPDGDIYTLGSDSKLIGRIFELISTCILQEIADENGYILEPSEQQTVYPDFTMLKDSNDNRKIAIDIKTTYRDYNASGEMKKIGFTLGSYNSFMRNGTKNIKYPYSEYDKHYIIGFIYSRNDNAGEGQKYPIDSLGELTVPYYDVEVFVQEKYKIAGEKPGSGNTENIGSFKTKKVEHLINGEDPFAVLGNEIYEDYWSNYPKYRVEVKEYTNIDEYIAWKEDNGVDIRNMKTTYELWKSEHE